MDIGEVTNEEFLDALDRGIVHARELAEFQLGQKTIRALILGRMYDPLSNNYLAYVEVEISAPQNQLRVRFKEMSQSPNFWHLVEEKACEKYKTIMKYDPPRLFQ